MPRRSQTLMSSLVPGSRGSGSSSPQVKSDIIDDPPILLTFGKEMSIAEAVDRAIPKVHGNRTGFSYGHLALGFVGSIGTQCDHRLSVIEGWSIKHRHLLERVMGKKAGTKDFTDDRLAELLWELGDPEVGQRIVRAYQLPTETGRADTTSVSVYHAQEGEEGLLRFGKSKNHRPDLRQFIQVLGTLDPGGIPLTTSTLPGNRADDGVYWPTWQRMARILGRTDWLYVGESKLHSAENLARIARADGYFLTPIPMKGNVPEEFDEWLKSAPKKLTPVRLPDAKGEIRIVGHGFEVERGFHRLKGGILRVAPIFLRTERHIRGLLLIVSMVLRLLTLVEFVTRRNLAAAKTTLSGMYDGLPKKATARPTAERLMRQFDGITLLSVRVGKKVHRQLLGFTSQHKKILKYMGLPASVYTALETG